MAAFFFFLFCTQLAGLMLQSESSLPESREQIIKEPWGALSLNLAIGVELWQEGVSWAFCWVQAAHCWCTRA